MIAISERLGYWTAEHPDWTPNADWPREVGSVLYDHPETLVLVDPLIRDDWFWVDEAVTAAGNPVTVLLTAPWHRRSTGEVIARYNARVWASPVARGRLGELPWLESLPQRIEAFVPRGVDEGQVAFFVEPERALVVAEFFSGAGAGLEVCPSPATEDRHEFIASLRELEEMDIERVLVAHGPPVLEGGNEAISAALRACG